MIQPPTHCDQCGEEPKHKQLSPLKPIGSEWWCERCRKEAEKNAVYVCTKGCRAIALGEGEEKDESIPVKAGTKGVMAPPVKSGLVRLRVQSGSLIEMATPVFVSKWRKES